MALTNQYVPPSFANQSRPRVLPTNGELPEGERARYSPIYRIGKLTAFRDEQAAYDSGQWLKAIVARAFHGTVDARAENYCHSIGFDIQNAMSEGTGAAGGYLVPAPISSAIIEVRERVGVARQVCNVTPMTSDTLTVPKRTGGLSVYVVGETQAITASDKSWGQVAVAARKRACLSYISQELSDDAIINLADNIFGEMAYALALQEDDDFINGTGAATYGGVRGLLSSIGAGGVQSADTGENLWSELDIDDFTNTIAKLPDRYHVYPTAWICSHSFFNSVMVRLAFAAGGVTASEVMGGTPNVRSFLGYPVYLTSKMPTAQADSTKCALFGAFSQAVLFGDRGGIRIARSDDFKFSEDLISLKATSRYDVSVHDAGTASAAGAYVALATTAA